MHGTRAWRKKVYPPGLSAWTKACPRGSTCGSVQDLCFFLQKHWLQGKEYHMITRGETSIILKVEPVEGKDLPDELGKKSYEEYVRQSVELLLRMA